MATIGELIKRPGGRGFYAELQLVLSVARLEEIELAADSSFVPAGVVDHDEPHQLLVKYHGVFLLYRLLRSINDGSLAGFLLEVRRVDPRLSSFCQLCHLPREMAGGRLFWHWVNTVVFSPVPTFCFWNYKTRSEETLYNEAAVDALRVALRASPFDPIVTLATYIRHGGMNSFEARSVTSFADVFEELFSRKPDNYFVNRYGSQMALPLEQVERLGEMNYQVPPPSKANDVPAPYPR